MGQRCRPLSNGRSADSAACGKAPRPVLCDRAVHHGILGFAGRVVAREGPVGELAGGEGAVVGMFGWDGVGGGVGHGSFLEGRFQAASNIGRRHGNQILRQPDFLRVLVDDRAVGDAQFVCRQRVAQ